VLGSERIDEPKRASSFTKLGIKKVNGSAAHREPMIQSAGVTSDGDWGSGFHRNRLEALACTSFCLRFTSA